MEINLHLRRKARGEKESSRERTRDLENPSTEARERSRK